MEFEKAVKVIFVNPKKEFLLHLRDDKPSIPCPGHWGFIGGAVDEGETPEEAIVREVKEEIELSIDAPEKLGSVFVKEKVVTKKNWENIIFKANIDLPIDKIKLNEGQRLGYFRFEELGNLKIAKYWLEFIRENKDKILE